MSIIALKWTALGDLWQILNQRASPQHYLTRCFLSTVAWATALICFYTCTNKQTGYVLSSFSFASHECKTSLLSAQQPLLMEASACIVQMDFEFTPSASPLELRRFINAFCFNHLLYASHLSFFLFFFLPRSCKWPPRGKRCPSQLWWTATSGWRWTHTTTCARRWPPPRWCATSTTAATDPSGR